MASDPAQGQDGQLATIRRDGLMRRHTDSTPTDAAAVTTSTSATSGHIEAQEPQQPTQGKKRKSNRTSTSAAAVTKYQLSHYDRFELKLFAGDKQKLRDAAAAEGISANALIIKAINAYLDSDILTPLASNPYI